MLSRRSLLAAATATILGFGCSKPPALPPAASFLKNVQLLDREGQALPNEWVVPQSNPIDPTIRFETVAPPSVLSGRKVAPVEYWIVAVEVRDENDASRWSDQFQHGWKFAEETLMDDGGLPVWESPDAPNTLPKGVIWQWCHCRIAEAGRFTLVVKLYPTAFSLPNSPRVDYGEGIELVRQTLIIEPAPKLEGSLMMSIHNGNSTNRTAYRRARTKNK